MQQQQDEKSTEAVSTGDWPLQSGTVRYIDRREEGPMLIFPNGTIPASFEPEIILREPTVCSVEACHNPKRYLHSRTLRPVCSLQCYQKIK